MGGVGGGLQQLPHMKSVHDMPLGQQQTCGPDFPVCAAHRAGWQQSESATHRV